MSSIRFPSVLKWVHLLAISSALLACTEQKQGAEPPQPSSAANSSAAAPASISDQPAASYSVASSSGASSTQSADAAQEFRAVLHAAPADGDEVRHIVRLAVRGQGIRAAQLLPPADGKPYALFEVAEDGTHAWVDFDSRTVGNGRHRFSIKVYDRHPAAEASSVISVMPARTWVIDNPVIQSPYPGAYPLRRDGQALQAATTLSDEEFRKLIQSDWPRLHALLQQYIPDNVQFTPPVPRGFEGPRTACIEDAYAAPQACREYMLRILMLIS